MGYCVVYKYSDFFFFFCSYVVNFDFPRNIEDYVHRIGRTGRAGYVVFSVACIGTAKGGTLPFFPKFDFFFVPVINVFLFLLCK